MAAVEYIGDNGSTSERGKRYKFTVGGLPAAYHQIEVQAPVDEENRRIYYMVYLKAKLNEAGVLHDPSQWPDVIDGLTIPEPD